MSFLAALPEEGMEMMVELSVKTSMQFSSPTGIIGNYNHGQYLCVSACVCMYVCCACMCVSMEHVCVCVSSVCVCLCVWVYVSMSVCAHAHKLLPRLS